MHEFDARGSALLTYVKYYHISLVLISGPSLETKKNLIRENKVIYGGMLVHCLKMHTICH